ncbi:tRNA (guanine(46)-N(7))-methyltransferase TrmB [Thalassobaculum sp.]|uniref:tRNA (guanine(46)-N(7))-methyltransferase TrmB n=1 Tax=Thalassobaculum sp. TaxID=2022740 RepID=UPI003B5C548F
MSDHGEERLFFGRRKGRPLRVGMQRRIDEDLVPRLVPVETSPANATDPKGWFPQAPRAVWLEIGFGGGEHLAWQAQNNPGVALIGCEPFVNGVASLLRHLDEVDGDRVRIHPDDARDVLDVLAPESLERIFVLHADPWPKRRHHYRRIIQHETVARFYELLKPGGILRMATDDPGYLVWILARITAHPEFRWTGTSMADFTERREDWPETRYEAKARREGRMPAYMEFRKPAETGQR